MGDDTEILLGQYRRHAEVIRGLIATSKELATRYEAPHRPAQAALHNALVATYEDKLGRVERLIFDMQEARNAQGELADFEGLCA